MFIVIFSYADHRVAGYEQFGCASTLTKTFATKRNAWNFIREVERHEQRNDSIELDELLVIADAKQSVYHCEYHRQQVAFLYDHVDCHGGVFRYVR